MNTSQLSVREIQEPDIEHLANYWTSLTPDSLLAMGADPTLLPPKADFSQMLLTQILKKYPEKTSYCLIWLYNGIPVGHSNVNKIKFGEEAYMHLHMWDKELRKQGLGHQFVKLCLPLFFKNLDLKKIYSEPYSLNAAPHKTLEKAGFKYLRAYTCVPGMINFEQEVRLWEYQKKSTFLS